MQMPNSHTLALRGLPKQGNILSEMLSQQCYVSPFAPASIIRCGKSSEKKKISTTNVTWARKRGIIQRNVHKNNAYETMFQIFKNVFLPADGLSKYPYICSIKIGTLKMTTLWHSFQEMRPTNWSVHTEGLVAGICSKTVTLPGRPSSNYFAHERT